VRRLPVHLSSEALRDIAGIRQYLLKEAGPAVSARVVGRIRKSLAAIERMPRTGSLRPEFGEGVRFHISGSYVIYVAVGDDSVEVLRILHAAQDRDAIMSKREE
jgi:plasmid stabilization system protein ParE